MREATCSDGLYLRRAQIEYAEQDLLAGEILQHAEIEGGLGSLDRNLLGAACQPALGRKE